jgi:hypothetical protein
MQNYLKKFLTNIFFIYYHRRDFISKLEILLESENLKGHLKTQVVNVSKKLEEKFRKVQGTKLNCIRDGKNEILIYDLDNINPIYCGLGCHLHGISAAFICAIEYNKQLVLINFQNQFEKYFDPFKISCKYEKKNGTIPSKKSFFVEFCEIVTFMIKIIRV